MCWPHVGPPQWCVWHATSTWPTAPHGRSNRPWVALCCTVLSNRPWRRVPNRTHSAHHTSLDRLASLDPGGGGGRQHGGLELVGRGRVGEDGDVGPGRGRRPRLLRGRPHERSRGGGRAGAQGDVSCHGMARITQRRLPARVRCGSCWFGLWRWHATENTPRGASKVGEGVVGGHRRTPTAVRRS